MDLGLLTSPTDYDNMKRLCSMSVSASETARRPLCRRRRLRLLPLLPARL